LVFYWDLNLIQAPQVKHEAIFDVRRSGPTHMAAGCDSKLALINFSKLEDTWNLLESCRLNNAAGEKLLLLNRVIARTARLVSGWRL
jgi:hypothetical protein